MAAVSGHAARTGQCTHALLPVPCAVHCVQCTLLTRHCERRCAVCCRCVYTRNDDVEDTGYEMGAWPGMHLTPCTRTLTPIVVVRSSHTGLTQSLHSPRQLCAPLTDGWGHCMYVVSSSASVPSSHDSCHGVCARWAIRRVLMWSWRVRTVCVVQARGGGPFVACCRR
jgi:hypothetical protein